ncbi:hypothetical protein JB92DRAFT_2830212 [Gautieria morchelliformis]|nr:hypothetical protein JB92DRAFT_2830212 [Gautieria morchelliformis]
MAILRIARNEKLAPEVNGDWKINADVSARAHTGNGVTTRCEWVQKKSSEAVKADVPVLVADLNRKQLGSSTLDSVAALACPLSLSLVVSMLQQMTHGLLLTALPRAALTIHLQSRHDASASETIKYICVNGESDAKVPEAGGMEVDMACLLGRNGYIHM